jgi:hypothetical protein
VLHGIGALRYLVSESSRFGLSAPTKATTHNGSFPIFRFGLLTFPFRSHMAFSQFRMPKQSLAQSGGFSCLCWSGGYSAGEDKQAKNESGIHMRQLRYALLALLIALVPHIRIRAGK